MLMREKQAPVALDIRSPMDLVYECFVKLGLRYICVLRDGKYAGMVSSTFSSSSPMASLPTYSTPLLPCETGGERVPVFFLL